MDKIFENLYENVSEACFEDIVSMVEELLSEEDTSDTFNTLKKKVLSNIAKRKSIRRAQERKFGGVRNVYAITPDSYFENLDKLKSNIQDRENLNNTDVKGDHDIDSKGVKPKKSPEEIKKGKAEQRFRNLSRPHRTHEKSDNKEYIQRFEQLKRNREGGKLQRYLDSENSRDSHSF